MASVFNQAVEVAAARHIRSKAAQSNGAPVIPDKSDMNGTVVNGLHPGVTDADCTTIDKFHEILHISEKPDLSRKQSLIDPSPSTRQQRLLLVDDNQINLRILTTVATKLGHAFITATNGQESVQAYEAAHHRVSDRPFDVVFMDISMPVLNGFEASRAIRSFERAHGIAPTYIVALTGLGDGLSRQEAFQSGMNLFLLKPLKLSLIKKVLDERESRGPEMDKERVDVLGRRRRGVAV